MSPDRRPFLYDAHVDLGAKIVPFGGWEMPLAYPSGTVAEHMACRSDAVVFDVSHLGTVRLEGDHFDTLQHVLSNDLRKVAPGRAQYTHLLNDAGGVEDDIIVWWVGEREFDVMPNASNTSRVRAAVPGVDVTGDRVVLAVQGPTARQKVSSIDPAFGAIGRFCVTRVPFAGAEVRVAGTGYTGEDGVEIAAPNAVAEELFARIRAAGVVPAGLGARDTLRLEAALPLHGHDLSPTISPIEARLGWVIGWDKSEFVGRPALEKQRDGAPHRWMAAVRAEGRQPLRDHAGVTGPDGVSGELTSGNFSPLLGCGIGLALLDQPVAPGVTVHVDVRGRQIAATVVKAPFVKKAA